MPTYKLQVQDDDTHHEVWRDVLDDRGAPLLFQKESDARAKLVELFPVLVKMESLGVDRKRTRVIIVGAYADADEEKED
jgi:hypothetical protein